MARGDEAALPHDVVERVLSQLDREALARDCLAYVSVPSETGREREGAEFLADAMRAQGWQVELDEAARDRPNVLVRLPGAGGGGEGGEGGDASGRCLLVNGHVDTIPIGKSWPARRDERWIWGRGAEDMKGGLVAMVHAARAIERAGVKLRGDLWLSGVVGHETPGGKKEGPQRLMGRIRNAEAGASGVLTPDAILITEGPCAIWRASLGSAIFHLTLRDSRAPVHTLRVPYAQNPVRGLRNALEELDRLSAELATRPVRSLAGADQLNVGMVVAGDYPNRLPIEARITGTRRWGPGQSASSVREELGELAERAARASGMSTLSGEARLEAAREPFETPTDDPLVAALRWSGGRVSGAAPEEIGLALVGDASLYANELGLPCAYYGPGYETAHSDAERVSIDRLLHIAQVYALTMMSYCGIG